MKKPVLTPIILLVVMILPSLLMAQGPPDPSDAMVPLDGGLSILLGAAAAYGSHKIRQYRKGKNV